MKIDDITVLLQHIDIKAESRRNAEDPQDASLRRFKDKWLFVVTLFLVIGTFISLCLFVAMRPDSTHTGMAITSGIGLVMALAGYYVRGT